MLSASLALIFFQKAWLAAFIINRLVYVYRHARSSAALSIMAETFIDIRSARRMVLGSRPWLRWRSSWRDVIAGLAGQCRAKAITVSDDELPPPDQLIIKAFTAERRRWYRNHVGLVASFQMASDDVEGHRQETNLGWVL